MANMLDGHIAEYLRISDDDADLGGEKGEQQYREPTESLTGLYQQASGICGPYGEGISG